MSSPDNSQKKPTSSFYDRFVRGEVSFGMWSGVARGIALLNTAITVSALTLYEYGAYQLLLASYSVLSVFTGVGASVARNDITRAIGEGDEPRAKKSFFEFAVLRTSLGLLVWAIAFFGAPLLAFRFGPDFIVIIRILSLMYLQETLWKLVDTLLLTRSEFSLIARRAPLNKAVQFVILGGMLLWFDGIGIKEVVISQVVAAFVAMFSLVPAALKNFRLWAQVTAARQNILLPALRTYGKWDLFRPIEGQLMSAAQPWIIKLVIGTEAVAIFSVAKVMVGTLKGFFTIKTLSTLIPLAAHDLAKSQRIFTYGTKYLLLYSLVLAAGGALAAPLFLALPWYNQYLIVLPYFYVMLLNIPVTAIGSLSYIFIEAYRKQKFLFFRRILHDVTSIVLFILLVPLFGLWGMAIEYILTPLLMFVVVYVYLMKRMHPRLVFEWHIFFSWNDMDREFLRNVCRGFSKLIPGFLRKRSDDYSSRP